MPFSLLSWITFFVSCLRNGLSQPFKKLIVRKFSGINGNPSAKGNTLWPQGKHFLEHVILHSPVTIIGRGRKREREKKSYSLGGSREVLKGKKHQGVAVRRQGNLTQESMEQRNITLFV